MNTPHWESELDTARKLYQAAADFEQLHRERSTRRGRVHSAWQGSLVPKAHALADQESAALEDLAMALRADAVGWSRAWIRKVNNRNHREYLTARARQQMYLDDLEAQIDESNNWFGDIVDSSSDLVGNAPGQRHDSVDDVPSPPSFDEFNDSPRSPMFEPFDNYWANYYRTYFDGTKCFRVEMASTPIALDKE